jgi:hypothetical protein
MNSVGFDLHAPDRIKRRVMFALELVDPITGGLATGLVVEAPGLPPPVLTPSGRYVWTDFDPPAQRHVKVTARSRRGIFAPFEAEFDTPARLPGVGAPMLVQRFALEPTGFYEPPDGMLAAAGQLLVSAADRSPRPQVPVTLQFRDAALPNGLIDPGHVGRTDPRGQFVTVARRLADEVDPAPPPAPWGQVIGWLTFSPAGEPPRHTGLLPLRKGRLLRLGAPLLWSALSGNPPP